MIKLAPSILSADFSKLADDVRKIEGKIKIKLVEQKELNKQEILAQAYASMTE